MGLTINFNAGFFACCSVKLYRITRWISKYKYLPRSVNSTNMFVWYKKEGSSDDITFDYFEHYNQ